jgi:glycosyltransferase involved in cell wall biosynthesis
MSGLRRLEYRQSRLHFQGGGQLEHQDQLALRLAQLGVQTSPACLLYPDTADGFHVFHVWSLADPREALAAMEWAASRSLPRVLTPMLPDPARVAHAEGLAKTFLRLQPQHWSKTAEQLEHGTLRWHPASSEPATYETLRQRALALADRVCSVGTSEALRLAARYGVPTERITLTPLGVRAGRSQPAPARQDPFVLIAGSRLEPVKNQLTPLIALRRCGFKLVVTGKPTHARYAALCKAIAPRDTEFLGEVTPTRLRHLLAASRVTVHASFAEVASMTVLEAATAAGGSLVLSPAGAEREALGDLPRYVDPADPKDILDKVVAAWQRWPLEGERRAAVAAAAARATWEEAAARTLTALEAVRLTTGAVGSAT